MILGFESSLLEPRSCSLVDKPWSPLVRVIIIRLHTREASLFL
jgi:hypothetical protein